MRVLKRRVGAILKNHAENYALALWEARHENQKNIVFPLYLYVVMSSVISPPVSSFCITAHNKYKYYKHIQVRATYK